ncbi:MAG: ABC transporter permease [Acidobacteria bacterium]|nr:MAG: ABC transporter permease [Acidobacteriota bacterium]
MKGIWQDIRYGVRQFRREPGFLAVVVVSLALGIGANSTIFSVLNAVLYRPMPYEHPERLVVVWQTERGRPDSIQPPPIAEVVDVKKQDHVFEDIGLISGNDSSTLSGLGRPEPVRVQQATASYFSVLGVTPILGRIFLPQEMQDDSEAVLISDLFWSRKFNRDPKVIGKTFKLDGAIATVVGVMPPTFASFYGRRTDVWLPIDPSNARYSARIDHWLMPVARLKPGVTLAQAQVEMDVIARRLEQSYPATNKGMGKEVLPLHQQLFGFMGQALYPLFGAVGFVLLIACVNVANLLQSRTEVRRKEYALRAALGSGRRRLIQQLFAESGLLALLGGGLGVILTLLGIAPFRWLASDFPLAKSINLDFRVLVFTLGVSLLSAFLFGFMPAIQASRTDLNLVLREAENRTSTASRGWARPALAVSEVALAMVLLTGAGLMISTIIHLHEVNPGFDAKNVATARVQVPEQGGKYLVRVPGGDMEKPLPLVGAFYQQLLAKVIALPGVESAGVMSNLPTNGSETYSFSILGKPAPPPDQRPNAGCIEVSADLFRTLRIPLKRGRYLDEHDTQSAPWTVVINEAFARRYFPNEDPIGQQLLLRYEPWPIDEDRPRQIVGVVGDVKHWSLGQPASPFVYTSYLQQSAIFPGGAVLNLLDQNLVVRMASGLAGHEADLGNAMRKAVADLNPDLPITEVRTMDAVLAESIGDWQFYMRSLAIFAGIAVLLAVVGIYGVMSYFVNERTHEFGIRMALGALPSDVLSLVGKLGLRLTLIGVAIGILLAVGLTRLIARFLVDVKPTDAVTYAVVSIVLVGVALLACYIPARRATKVDPMVALRYE